jgi:hypothetical protein
VYKGRSFADSGAGTEHTKQSTEHLGLPVAGCRYPWSRPEIGVDGTGVQELNRDNKTKRKLWT